MFSQTFEYRMQSPFTGLIWRLSKAAPRENKLGYMNDQLRRNGLHTVPDYAGCRILIDHCTCDCGDEYASLVGSIISVDDTNGVSLLSTMPDVINITARTLPCLKDQWNELELYQAEDGANIGIYWFRGRWLVRTPNSFDAGGITWDGSVTFGQMVNDIMIKYPRFRLSELDTNKCYTFGIKHPAIHMYHEGSPSSITRAWFIQSVNIARVNETFGDFTNTINFDESIGLPLQLPLKAYVFANMSQVKFTASAEFQPHVSDELDAFNKIEDNGARVSLRDIICHTRGAIGSVIALSSGGSTSTISPARGYFGVILRTKKCTFFVPSDLYQFIATTSYTNELNEMFDTERFNRAKFFVLFNALCSTDERKIFTCIYTQFTATIAKIRDYLTNEFISAMYAVHNNLTNGSEIDKIYSDQTIDLARSIYIVWARRYGTPKSSERSKLITLFTDYVLCKHNARVLYNDVYASVPFACA